MDPGAVPVFASLRCFVRAAPVALAIEKQSALRRGKCTRVSPWRVFRHGISMLKMSRGIAGRAAYAHKMDSCLSRW